MNNSMKNPIIFLLMIPVLLSFHTFAQTENTIPADFFMGKWGGSITIQTINRSGGWDDSGFLGFHETTKEIWDLYLDIEFVHPFDDPSFIQECKKLGYPDEYIKGLKYLMPIPDELKIIGHVTQKGFKEDTHETKIYCEECAGKDGTTTKNFPSICVPVTGRVNLLSSTIDMDFIENDLEEYCGGLCFESEYTNFVTPNKIVYSFKDFEGPIEERSFDRQITGELHKIPDCKKKDSISLIDLCSPLSLSTEFKDNTTIYPNGTKIQETHDKLIVTTNDGCAELYITETTKITCADGTEMSMVIRKMLDGSISSDVYKGYIHVDIWEGGKHHHFFTRNAIVEVSGTNFTMEVSKDGTTILTVLDGEVEFSDVKKKKTILVKKNQKSIVKPGGLPTEPEAIEQNQIPRWWE